MANLLRRRRLSDSLERLPAFRADVEPLVNGELWVEPQRLPDPGAGVAYTYQLVGLEVRTEDGGLVESYAGEVGIDPWGPDAPIGLPVYAPNAMKLSLSLPAPGMYAITLNLDGVEAASIHFMAHLT